jgi:hypothetical protein
MKAVLFATLALAVGGSAAQAIDIPASRSTEGAHFAAVSVTDSQGVRVIISNVLTPTNGADLSPCPVQVTFVGGDGSLMGDATTVQLKPGESTSVPTSVPASLVRAIVSIGNVPDSPKLCALRTSLEVFDAQTGTTFISIAGESNVGNGECSAPARVLGASKSAPGRENTALEPAPRKQISRNSVPIASPHEGRVAPSKIGPSVLALTPPSVSK